MDPSSGSCNDRLVSDREDESRNKPSGIACYFCGRQCYRDHDSIESKVCGTMLGSEALNVRLSAELAKSDRILKKLNKWIVMAMRGLLFALSMILYYGIN